MATCEFLELLVIFLLWSCGNFRSVSPNLHYVDFDDGLGDSHAVPDYQEPRCTWHFLDVCFSYGSDFSLSLLSPPSFPKTKSLKRLSILIKFYSLNLESVASRNSKPTRFNSQSNPIQIHQTHCHQTFNFFRLRLSPLLCLTQSHSSKHILIFLQTNPLPSFKRNSWSIGSNWILKAVK